MQSIYQLPFVHYRNILKTKASMTSSHLPGVHPGAVDLIDLMNAQQLDFTQLVSLITDVDIYAGQGCGD